MLQEINKELLLWFNSLLDYNIIEQIAILCVDLPIFFLPIFLSWMWIYYTYYKKDTVVSDLKLTPNLLEKEWLLFIFYSIVIWLTISITIQQFVNIERPEKALEWVWKLLLNHIPDASFPSDHATVVMTFLWAIFMAWYKKTWYIFMPFAIIMVLSRVILWVHWPFDILAWTIIWIFASFITFKYLINCKYLNNFNRLIIKMMKKIKL